MILVSDSATPSSIVNQSGLLDVEGSTKYHKPFISFFLPFFFYTFCAFAVFLPLFFNAFSMSFSPLLSLAIFPFLLRLSRSFCSSSLHPSLYVSSYFICALFVAFFAHSLRLSAFPPYFLRLFYVFSAFRLPTFCIFPPFLSFLCLPPLLYESSMRFLRLPSDSFAFLFTAFVTFPTTVLNILTTFLRQFVLHRTFVIIFSSSTLNFFTLFLRHFCA